MTDYRTDRNNNPTAFITELAVAAGLSKDEFTQGDPFEIRVGNINHTYYTAKLFGNPIATTIKVLDKIGFTVSDNPFKSRWTYINIPESIWNTFSVLQKTLTIQQMYHYEGGIELQSLFDTAIKSQSVQKA